MTSLDRLLEPVTYSPPPELARQAHVAGRAAYAELVTESEEDYEGYWARLAREFVHWKHPFHKVLGSERARHYTWFEDGTLNVSWNCLDRQVAEGRGDKVAIIFEADGGEVTRTTYAQLLAMTCRLANALKARGVSRGDRVAIYMPMSVEAMVAMQACARIGATHTVVFGGFSAHSLRDRIADTGAVLLLTADEQMRGGKALPLKAIADEALALGGCEAVRDVIVYRRTGGSVPWTSRDHWLHELSAAQPDRCTPEWVGAEQQGLPISSAGAESVVDDVIGQRMKRNGHMRWTREGANALLQVRCAVLNGQDIRNFKRWYPPDRRIVGDPAANPAS